MDKSLIIKKFKELYKKEPIISRSPGRVNLIGEHTDYNDGFVLPAAVDKEIVFALQKNSSNTVRVFALDLNESGEFFLDNFRRSEGWINYIIGVFAELSKKGVKVEGTDILFSGNVPLGSGMSSSAALECALATGLNYLYNGNLSQIDLALVSQAAEHNFAGVKCGIMDQYASVFGKKNKVIKLDCRTLEHIYYDFDFADYLILLCDTNVKHTLASSEYNTRRSQCERGVEIIKRKYPNIKNLRDVDIEMIESCKDEMDEIIYKRCRYVIDENNRVEKACEMLEMKNFKAFGELMYKSHEGLRDMYEVSCSELDFLVEETLKHSYVLGARMMGGGFGGCTINLIHKDYVDEFVNIASQKYFDEFKKEMKNYIVRVGDGARIETNN